MHLKQTTDNYIITLWRNEMSLARVSRGLLWKFVAFSRLFISCILILILIRISVESIDKLLTICC